MKRNKFPKKRASFMNTYILEMVTLLYFLIKICILTPIFRFISHKGAKNCLIKLKFYESAHDGLKICFSQNVDKICNKKRTI